ncbi:MAG TPA: Ig-like domain-containing protein, partial [Ilumatobacteraceae bacterium]
MTIQVLQAPPAPEPDEFGVRQGTTLSVPAPGVLGNDLSSWIPLSATLVRPPLGATVALRSDGGFTFTPFPETVGPVTFTYRTQFEGSAPSDPVTVTIDVVDAADPPEAHPDVVTTPEGASVVVAPLANDVDPDGDPVTLVGYEQGALGKVSCNLAASCTYTPTPDATGEDSWRYTVTDGTGRRSRGTVRVTITPVDEPPAPADDVLRFVKGVNGALDLLANDADPDGGPLTFVGISDQPDSGSLVCDAVGVCTYTPANATVSGDEATYVVRDDDGVEASATVAIRAFAAFEEIESPGPILFIQGGSTLGCGAEYTGDDLGSFFAEFACGTFLASGGALYGPANIPGDGTNQPQPRTTFTPLRQSFVEGDGSPDDPFRITTTVAAGASGLELTQVDTYVTGATSYRTDLTVTNIGGGPANATLWRAGDCQRADSDTGFGRLDPTTGAVACVGADGRALEWFPLSAGSAAFEGDPIDMWEVIATRAAFPNTCRCADDIDNAAGLSWTVALAPGESTTRSHLTVFAPSGAAPISLGIAADESEVGPGASNGFTLTATNTDAISDSSLSQLRAVLPPGFSYVPGTTTGLGEPTVDGGVVQWNGPLVIGSSGSLVVHIGVIASDAAGIHTAKVDGTSADAAVAVGPGADVTVSEGALPPLPLFGATPTLLAVDFDAADSLDDGEIVAFAWAYGDGASGSGETSAHSYAAPGTYDVTLTVTDDDGYVRSTTKPVTVSDPNAGPTAIGTFMPARPVTAPAGAGPAFVAAALEPDFTGLSIVFDGTQSFDDDGSIIGWAWDFGDGSSGSGAVIEHEFPGPGHYIVRLTVTDDEGASATATIPVDVTVPPNVPPTADFEYVVDALSVDFDGTASVDP